MRELTSFELALVSGGGSGSCEHSGGEEYDGCIIGTPPPDLPNYPPSPPPPPSYEPPSYGGGGNGEPTPTPCVEGKMDVAADGMKDQINANPQVNSKEFKSAIYRDANGNVQTYGPIEGVPTGVLGATWTFPGYDFTAATGLQTSNILGTVHNHPYAVFGHDPDLNRYPSQSDWWAAERDVNAGADPLKYSIYVIDTGGIMREFPYSMKSFFETMSPDSKRLGYFLPNPIDNPPPPTCG